MTSVSRRQERQDPDSEYSDASHAENDHDNSGNDAGQAESDYDSAGSESDRSDRDPDNQETERRVDDDEDRSNPQYIPKRGTFYEHDDRTAASGEDSIVSTSETASEKKEIESPADRRRGPRKSESVNKWSHDKYNENEQMPKSRDELVAIYGYDIRNEDAPPHARRNRRYGRGPNKYTRTWEDVDAYRRQANAPTPNRKPPNPEDFPELEASNRSSKKRAPRPRSKSQPSSIDSSDQGSQLRRNASVKATKNKPPPRQNIGNKNAPRRDQKRDVKKDVKEKMPPIENLTITSSTLNNSASQPQRKVNAAVAQQRPVPTEQGKKKPPPPQAQQPQQQNNAAPNKSPPLQQAPQAQQQKPPPQNQPPGEQRGGSKRYSSLRQRPLDTYSPQQPQQPPPQQPQQQHRYHGEYTGGAPAQHQGSPAPQMHPQQMMQQSHRSAPVITQQHGPSPPHQQLPQQQLPQQQLPQQQLPQQQLPQQQLPQQQLPQQQLPQQQLPQQQLPQQQLQQQQLPQQHSQQVRLGMMEQQPVVPHSHHSIHNMPQPHTIVSGQLPPGQPYAPPAMMPAQYMQQGGSGAVFGGAAMYAQPPVPYQMYQRHNYATQAGGVTYYSCAEQDVAVPGPTTAPRQPRRPTAAIPIVRPHHTHLPQDRPANSSEKDNIDRIVENMFVRKPWPATHGADASKEKSETRNSQEPQSKESSQPNSLTSSSISTDSKPSEIEKESKEESKEQKENSVEKELKEKEFKEKELKEIEIKETELNERELKEKETKENEQSVEQESISTDA